MNHRTDKLNLLRIWQLTEIKNDESSHEASSIERVGYMSFTRQKGDIVCSNFSITNDAVSLSHHTQSTLIVIRQSK